MMMLFDWPEHLVSIGQRSTTTTAPQALMFMNSPLGRALRRGLRRPRRAGRRPADAVARAYRIAFGREPTDGRGAARRRFPRRPAVRLRARRPARARRARRWSTSARR